MDNIDDLIRQLFDTASEIVDTLDANDFEMTETDVLTDKTLKINIEVKAGE